MVEVQVLEPIELPEAIVEIAKAILEDGLWVFTEKFITSKGYTHSLFSFFSSSKTLDNSCLAFLRVSSMDFISEAASLASSESLSTGVSDRSSLCSISSSRSSFSS